MRASRPAAGRRPCAAPSVVLSLLLMVAALTLGLATTPPAARADVAVGGAGRFLDAVEWFSFGTAGATLPNSGITRTETYLVGGEPLAVTCTLNEVAGTASSEQSLQVYVPGSWQGDGLDDLYNSGLPGLGNTMPIGLVNRVFGDRITFDFSCAAAADGRPVPLPGLVLADAEQAGGSEFLGARPVPADTTTWRIIDRYRTPGCDLSSQAVRGRDNSLVLRGNDSVCDTGPMAVAFMDGARAAQVELAGGGRTALALGVVLPFDSGDAPASYGAAAALVPYGFTGGEVPIGTTAVNDASFALADVAQPPDRLGSVVDGERQLFAGPDADADDTDGREVLGGPDDEDAVTVPDPLVVDPGSPYVLAGVRCLGTARIAGWLDLDLDGRFGAGERSDVRRCSGGSVDLGFDVPADTLPDGGSARSMLRLRASSSGEPLAATGLTAAGEVEDHLVPALTAAPRLQVEASVVQRALAGDQFIVSATGVGADDITATTSGEQTTATSAADPVRTGATYTIRARLAASSPSILGDYRAVIVCRDISAGITLPTVDVGGGRWEIEGPAAGAFVRCAVTFTPLPGAARVAHEVLSAPEPTGRAGEYTTTTRISVRNAGALPALYDLADRLEYGAGATVVSSSVTRSDTSTDPLQTGTPGPSPTSDPRVEVVTGETVAGRRVESWDVTTVYTVDTDTLTAATADCRPDNDPGDGVATGSRSSAVLDSLGGTRTARACSPLPALRLSKDVGRVDVGADGRPDPGDPITWPVTVTNVGALPLTGLVVTDPRADDVVCAADALAVEAEATCTASATLRAGEIDRGRIVNTAEGASAETAPDADSVVTSLARESALSLTKTRAPGPVGGVGDRIGYRFRVTNTGNTTVRDLVVDDVQQRPAGDLDAAVSCPRPTLAPGAAITCTGTYTLTQADVDHGSVDDTATARGAGPEGEEVASAPASLTVEITQRASLLVATTAAPDPVTALGQRVGFRFRVTNDGEVTLAGVGVRSRMAPPGGALDGAVECGRLRLAPGATTTCRGFHTVTQADLDHGSLSNRATARALAPSGVAVTSDPTTTPIGVTVSAALSATLRIGPSDVDTVGERLRFAVTVTNPGALTLADLAVGVRSLPPAGAVSVTCPRTTLAPRGSLTCTGRYVVTKADVDTGSITGIASAVATTLRGETVRTTPSGATVPQPAGGPALALLKRADRRVVDRVGEQIRYTFTVVNTGGVRLLDLVVDDVQQAPAAALDAPLECAAAVLPIGGGTTCTATYTARTTDRRHGTITDTALASAVTAAGRPVVSRQSTVVVRWRR